MKKGFKITDKIITEEEFIKMISLPDLKVNKEDNPNKKLKKRRIKLALSLGFYGCLRRSEISKLEPEDFNPATKLLHIRQAKGKKDRMTAIAPEVFRGLKYLPIGASPSTINRWSHKYSKKALGKSINVHSLRHSGASHYLNVKKKSLIFVQRFLGHSDISITQIYLHLRPADMVKDLWD